ncbi:hypothetical protein BCR35DRAFT_288081 [Leucosporidium creatinivorum]|uniref:ATP-NAD kinase-like domain-containing protein n=1 Tax=Leucosporidium creatinivorum TaxID=106004 RepID=A0A1Y2FZ26_9BASI|nr:hypothetical protein BCR35DRAFT_288081 [Leucosporidium creatinivorum]
MPGTWVVDQRQRSPLSEEPPLSMDHRINGDSSASSTPGASGSSSAASLSGPPRPPAQMHRNIPPPIPAPTPPPQLLSAPATRSPTYSSTLASPCFVHSHLDHSLSDFVKRDAALSGTSPSSARRKLKVRTTEVAESLNRKNEAVIEDESETASEGEFDEDDPEAPSLTRQLAETAVSVREMSKQLGRARVVSHIQSVLIITKARDNHLIRLTRELALWLMQTPRNGRDRGLVVYVDSQLRKSKRFDAEGMERDNPELFRPLPRRYSRTSSSASLAGSGILEPPLKKMTALSSLSDALKRSNSTSTESGRRASGDGHGEEGQLRYWTNEMCSKSPHLFDFVITLGGDGTVLYASWLFQHVVPPTIPFALGSLGFLTNFDFSNYAYTLNHAIDNGIRVNLRMRFTCTVYRAIEGEENKKRRAVRSGKTGGIFMKSLTRDGWESIESGGAERVAGKGKGKDKEIKCFVTRPVESFEVLNDLVVDRGPSPYVSLLELFGDDHHMTTVQADGLTVSTPTGSTAYSLSAGGSLVHPEIPALLITPICPHTLSFRPMLLPDSMELRICVPYNSRSTAWASFDGRGRVELRQGDHIKVTASQYPFPTVCADNQSTDWFHSISRTLKWNERERQKSFVVVEEGHKKPPTRQNSTEGKPPTSTTFGTARGGDNKSEKNFGNEEDDTDDDESDDELDDDEEEEEEINSEDEAFDIDDLSSENHTNSSSPSNSPEDPTSVVPPIPSTAVPTQVENPYSTHAASPRPNAPTHAHASPPPPHHIFTLQDTRASSAASSVAELNDDPRFRDPAPKPPRLSSRHSHTHVPTTSSSAPAAAPPISSSAGAGGGSRMSASVARRRERGEEGDRDHLRESLSVKRGVGAGATRRNRSRDKSSPRTPTGGRSAAEELEKKESGVGSEGGGFAFAVVGADSDTSVSDTDAF